MAVDMDSPSSSKMTVASFLISGSIRIVVAGMFDGMAVPFFIYQGAAILSSLCGGCDPVVHRTEYVADAAFVGAVCELTRDRAPGGIGIDRHEGSAPLELGEISVEVFHRDTSKRLHEGAKERMDGIDPVDGPLGAVLGIACRMHRDLEFSEGVDIG